ncbi:MAG: hypothetical protein R8L58_03580 [Mariprofundaceae bacterium]
MRPLWMGGLALVFVTGCACKQEMDVMHDADKPVTAIMSPESTAPAPDSGDKPAVRSAKHVKPAELKAANTKPLPEVAHKAPGKARIQGEHSTPKINLAMLTERLKNTDAIGVFTKLAIRSDIMDLKDDIARYRQKSLLQSKMKEVRERFDGLLLKIMALLDGDPDLSHDLYSARESIWESLLGVKA